MMTNRKYRAMSIVLGISLLTSTFTAISYSGKVAQMSERINELEQLSNDQRDHIEVQASAIRDKDIVISELQSLNEGLVNQVTESQTTSYNNGVEFEATAYIDGGNTASGFNLSGHSWDSARVIAVDPNVIPLGSQVYLEFDDNWSSHNGVYTAADTGGAIRGNIIDVFVGHGENDLAMSFGRRSVKVTIL